MAVQELIALRDSVDKFISTETKSLQKQLAALGSFGSSRPPKKRRHALAGRKVAPKYRNPNDKSQTWSGRGLSPRWMSAALKAGKSKDAFLIARPAKARQSKRK
jgi:DNA-binding protein H-NS